MSEENSETLFTVIIAGLKPGADKAKVADGIARIVKNLDAGKTLKRLESLPWTMTRKASRKNAGRLIKYLGKLNCDVEVIPPFEIPAIADVAETQILPGTALLSETQIMSSTQFMPVPDELSKQGSTQTSSGALSKSGPEPSSLDREPERQPEDVSLEPLTLGGILDKTFQICRANLWKLLAIAAIPWLITGLITVALAIVVGIIGLTVHNITNMSITMLVVAGVLIIPSAIVFFIAMFYLAQGAMIHAVSSTYLGRKINIKESYGFVFDRLGKFVLTSLLFTLMIFLATAMISVAGTGFYFLFKIVTPSGWWSAVTWIPLFCVLIYLIIKFVLFDKVIIIEDVAYMGALRRSWSLLTGKAEGGWPRSYWGRLVVLLNLFALISFTIAWLFQMPASLVAALFPLSQLAKTVLTQVLSNLGSLFGQVFGAVCLVIFYYDVRNRKEGFDLEMLAKMDEY
ncbi:MAG: hypothetical protein HY912_22480 [Desulfomonile tiedjei]|uniref:Glycerophosphoryl diester phosphodiesterase membrane domain-containing protein n=1 Tax=Desulfomonile tiedjei TaxID=2358 RepID=A0A9D6Z8N1_9BACT|nr:hypothetical protein [Desulfomonile tiedjei]